MLYVFKKNITPCYYIAGRKETNDNTGHAYQHTTFLSSAMLFNSVPDAISWLERTAYHNGQQTLYFDGSLCLIRVESVPVSPVPVQYKEIGPVK